MLNHIEGSRLSNKKRSTKVHAFPGAATEDMIDFIRPLAFRNPDCLIIHAGTSDLINFSTKDSLVNYKDIVDTIREINPNIKVIISSVIQRYDNNSLQPKIEELNSKLKSFCAKHKLFFIDHSNITDIHIGMRGLHLNRSGKARLALNLKECMNSL